MATLSAYKGQMMESQEMILRDYLGLKAVTPYTNNKVLPLQAADPSLLYGLELEIENVPRWEEMVITGMTSVEDGSLRNNGREFLTKPATFSVVHNILTRFFEKNKLTEDNYSERTSVHVHANCQDLTREQIASVCLLYQVFERLFYGFIGEDRDKNIFCIPWDQTMITYASIDAVLGAKGITALKGWQKYTGLNLLPLFGLGTIEFRHMAGTNDLDKISAWLNLIGSLFAYARNHPINSIKDTLINLNTTSAYDDTTHRVFSYWTKHLTELPNYRGMLEEGVLNMKYSLLKGPQALTARPFDADFALAQLHEAQRQDAERRREREAQRAAGEANGAAAPDRWTINLAAQAGIADIAAQAPFGEPQVAPQGEMVQARPRNRNDRVEVRIDRRPRVALNVPPRPVLRFDENEFFDEGNQ